MARGPEAEDRAGDAVEGPTAEIVPVVEPGQVPAGVAGGRAKAVIGEMAAPNTRPSKTAK